MVSGAQCVLLEGSPSQMLRLHAGNSAWSLWINMDSLMIWGEWKFNYYILRVLQCLPSVFPLSYSMPCVV